MNEDEYNSDLSRPILFHNVTYIYVSSAAQISATERVRMAVIDHVNDNYLRLIDYIFIVRPTRWNKNVSLMQNYVAHAMWIVITTFATLTAVSYLIHLRRHVRSGAAHQFVVAVTADRTSAARRMRRLRRVVRRHGYTHWPSSASYSSSAGTRCTSWLSSTQASDNR